MRDVPAHSRQGDLLFVLWGALYPVPEGDCSNNCCSVCDDSAVKCSELAAEFEMGQMDLPHHGPHMDCMCSHPSSHLHWKIPNFIQTLGAQPSISGSPVLSREKAA